MDGSSQIFRKVYLPPTASGTFPAESEHSAMATSRFVFQYAEIVRAET
jgi:hypothetical protein